MRLDEQGVLDREAWESAGYRVPQFDREKVRMNTCKNPFWIHFGAGNIFRAFQANVVQKLLNEGILDRGLIVAEGFDYEIIEKMNRPHDDYSIAVTLKADGSVEKTVVGSVVESRILDAGNDSEFMRLKEIFTRETLQIASFTITEKGYCLTNTAGELLPEIAADFVSGPAAPESYLGKVAALLYARFQAGQLPIAMVSMDNCSHNGEKLWEAMIAFAESWCKEGLVEEAFADYVKNPEKVAFPWTMIDKITPRPDAAVEAMLVEDGVDAAQAVVTSRNTYVAPFVNAEECEYLVIEDAFPNGRPELEKGGFLFTSRETVEKVERMKVCTCLNPLHTSLAVFGCVLGYTKISEEMKNPRLRGLAEAVGYEEGLPVVSDPGILKPEEFLDTVLNIRLPNPFMPDTPQRIATDTSQKLKVRFGETIKAYMASAKLKEKKLQYIPFVFAGWLRYLTGIDDKGEAFTLSPDPLLPTLRPYVSGLRLGAGIDREALAPLLEKESIWGVNLFEAGLAEQVMDELEEMLAGTGAVEKALQKKFPGTEEWR